MDLTKIEKLIDLLVTNHLEEIEFEAEGSRIKLKAPTVNADLVMPIITKTKRSPASVDAIPQAQIEEGSDSAEKVNINNLPPDKVVRTPFVGTFYEAPAPGAEPFVRVGQRVRKGDALCIVEAMKLMNEIEAERDGVIKDILVKNAQPVEYDQILFILE